MATKKKNTAAKAKSAKAKSSPDIHPLGDRVLIRPEEAEEEKTTAAGIIIPQGSEKEGPSRGVIIAVGEGRRGEDGELISPRVSEGETVLFSSYAFDKITIDGDEYCIVSEANILAVVG